MKKTKKIFSLHLNSNKPDNFEKFSKSFLQNCSDPNSLEIIVNIDQGDDLMKFRIKKINEEYNNAVKYIETDLIKNFNDAWKPINLLLKETSSTVKVVSCLSDDITVETKNWDQYFLNYLTSYKSDEIFRIRCSKNKYETYDNLWECGYKPDFSFYTKKWIDIVGFWNPCIGPDTFHETVSYHLNMYGSDFDRSIVDNNVIFKGEETLAGLKLADRIKRCKLGYISFSDLMSYKIQKESSESAYRLAKGISKNNIKLIKLKYFSHVIQNLFKKLRFFHYRGSKSYLTSNIFFNIIFILWCKINIFDKYVEIIIPYLEKKNILKKIITDKRQYKKLKDALNKE